MAEDGAWWQATRHLLPCVSDPLPAVGVVQPVTNLLCLTGIWTQSSVLSTQ